MLKIHFFQKYTYIKYLTILKSFNFDQSYVNDNTDKFKKDSDNFKNSFLYVPLLLSLETFISYPVPINFFTHAIDSFLKCNLIDLLIGVYNGSGSITAIFNGGDCGLNVDIRG